MPKFGLASVMLLGMLTLYFNPICAADSGATVEGTMVANGKDVELPHVYVYAQKQGFYSETDPTWTVLFVAVPVEERELDDHVWDAAYVRLGITETAEFGDEPEIQVYSQDIVFSADQGGNVSGGSYPKIELSEAGEDRWVGRIYHEDPQTIFDDTFLYNFTFSAPLSDPFGPIGDPLPAGGGEPGSAYLGFCAAIHAGDMETLKTLVPAEQAAMFDDEEYKAQFAEELEFMKLMTPTEIEIVDGSSDGDIAILNVVGMMEGEEVEGEITMERFDDLWINTKAAW